MSHISKIEIEVKDIGVLKKACARLGLGFVHNKKTFKWYGSNDGVCDHSIMVPGSQYEIGVTRLQDHFDLQCDYYDANMGKAIGQNGGFLKQAYAIEKTKMEARRKGYLVMEKKTDTGIRLQVRVN